MRKGWEYRKFIDCLYKVSKQKQVKSKDYQLFGRYPIVSQESELISGYWDDEEYVYKHDKPIIIFGDHTKNIKYIDFNFVVGADGTHILLPKDDIDSKYFYYAIKSIKLRDLGYARHFKLLKDNDIPVPSISEQQRIVTNLDSSFSKIDELKENVTKELSEAKALFQAELKKRMVKKDGWEEKKLGEVCSKISDGSHNPPRGVEHSEYLMLSSKNIRNDKFTFDNPRYLSSLDFERENQRTNVEKGDVLLTIVGAGLGDCCMYPSDKKVVFQRSAAVIKTCKDILLSRFLMYLIQANLDKIRKESNGAAQKGIYLNQLKEYKISLPNIFSQRQIVTHLDTLSQKIQELEKNYNTILAECDALKQAILRETFE